MGALLPILQIGLGAVTTFAQIGMAQAQYNAQVDALQKQATIQVAEIQRQEEEVNRVAVEQKADRIRQANLELGSVRVAALERGVSGTTMTAFARSIGYLEGVDLSRIEGNAKSNIAAGESQKAAAKEGYLSSVTIAANQRNSSIVSAGLGFIGSGLQIAGDYYKQQQYLDTLKNTS